MILQATFRDIDSEGRPATTRKVNFPTQASQAQYLRTLVKHYRNRLPLREKAVEIVRAAGVPAKQKAQQAKAIGEWTQANIYYVNEPEETFHTPLRTLQSGFGDCDDHSSLNATLCEAIGIPCELVCVGPWPSFVHIFARAIVPTGGGPRRLPLDSTLSRPIGTDPLQIARKRWPIRCHSRTF